MAKLKPSELKALLQGEKADALAGMSDSKLQSERSRALEYYNGDMSADMPVAAGRSSVTSSDVADTVEGLMPSLLEIFCGGDEVVRFDPVGPEDVKAAEQESDYVNHVFTQQNQGFLILYTFIKDALLSKVGVVKIWSEEYEDEKKETYTDQTDQQFMMLAVNPEITITEHGEKADEAGNKLHDVSAVSKKKTVKHCVENIAPEEFGIKRSAKSIQSSGYCYHEVARREAEAIEMGFDKAQIKALPTYTQSTRGTEPQARDTVEDSTTAGGDDGINTANRLVKITEHYVEMDYDGSGAKLYRVTTGGDQGDVLNREGKEDIEEVDSIPFAAMTPIIMPHRFYGKSVADLVLEIQRIKTALTRALLDNTYHANNPRMEVAESNAGPNTLDDMLVSRPGGIIRTKTPGGITPIQIPSIANHLLPTIEYFDATREWRTGVTRQGQGIDANALQNQSATAVNQAFTAAQARMKLIARIFAETGIRDLFSLLHATIRKHGSVAQTVRLRNQWVQVDPRDWKERNDLTINVGLGTGSKMERASQLMMLIGLQKEALAAGKSNLVQDDKLFNSAKELCKLLEYKDATQFFSDPTTMPPPPPPVDPKMMELQVKAQLDQQAMAQKAQIETVQAQADIATQDRKIQSEMVMAERKFQFESALATQGFELERELKMMDHQLKREQQAADLEMRREAHQQAIAAGAFKVAQGQEAHEQKMEASKGAE